MHDEFIIIRNVYHLYEHEISSSVALRITYHKLFTYKTRLRKWKN